MTQCKIVFLFQLVYKFSTILIKIPINFIIELIKLIPKHGTKRNQNQPSQFWKNHKVDGTYPMCHQDIVYVIIKKTVFINCWLKSMLYSDFLSFHLIFFLFVLVSHSGYHIALTLSKSNDKENILKAARKEIGKKAGGKKSDLQRMTHHLITRLLSRNSTRQKRIESSIQTNKREKLPPKNNISSKLSFKYEE